jgi:hypothetical protein
VIKVEPRKCVFFKNGETSDAASVEMTHLEWKNWGSSETTGKGKAKVPMSDEVTPGTVRLSKPVPSASCNTDIYSKAKFNFSEIDAKFSSKLYTSCET